MRRHRGRPKMPMFKNISSTSQETSDADTARPSVPRPIGGSVLQPGIAQPVRLSVLLLVPARMGAAHVAADLDRLSQRRAQGRAMMDGQVNWTAFGVFAFFFVLVTVLGFAASRWQRGKSNKGAHLDEWGLGGRNFGTWITW